MRRRFGQKGTPERRPGTTGSSPAAPVRPSPGGEIRARRGAGGAGAREAASGSAGRRAGPAHRPGPSAGGAGPGRHAGGGDRSAGPEPGALRVAGLPHGPGRGGPHHDGPGPQGVAKLLVDEIKGLGPLEPVLQDPDVSDILINGPNDAFVERRGSWSASICTSGTRPTSCRSRSGSRVPSGGAWTRPAPWWMPGCRTARG